MLSSPWLSWFRLGSLVVDEDAGVPMVSSRRTSSAWRAPIEGAQGAGGRLRHRAVDRGEQAQRLLGGEAQHPPPVLRGTGGAATSPFALETVEQPRDAGVVLDHARGDLQRGQAALAGAAQDPQHVVLLQRDAGGLHHRRQRAAQLVRPAQQRHHRLVRRAREGTSLLDLLPHGAHVRKLAA